MRSLRIILTAIVIFVSNIVCLAEADPLWLRKSDADLNANVNNSSYTLKVLNTHGHNQSALLDEKLYALEKYAKDDLGAIPSSVRIDSVSGGAQPTYWVYYDTPSSTDNFVVAKLVDQYVKFEDYAVNEYQYEYYQLFALSKPNEYPHYDEFELSKRYGTHIAPMALVPGFSQIYKGQKTKGYVIIGSEAFFVASAIVFDFKRAYAAKQYNTAPAGIKDSWRSKRNAWRNFRNGAIGCAAALYIYNVADALISEGGNRLTIHPVGQSNFSFTPLVAPDFAGMSLTLSF